jgi:hypothetical protein
VPKVTNRYWVEIKAGPSAVLPVQGTRFGFVGGAVRIGRLIVQHCDGVDFDQ